MVEGNGVSEKVQDQMMVLRKLDGSLHRFIAKKLEYSAYDEDDLKKVKSIRKSVGELRDEVQELVQNLGGPKYSVTSSNSRFASTQRVVSKFLGQ